MADGHYQCLLSKERVLTVQKCLEVYPLFMNTFLDTGVPIIVQFEKYFLLFHLLLIPFLRKEME